MERKSIAFLARTEETLGRDAQQRPCVYRTATLPRSVDALAEPVDAEQKEVN